MRNDELVYQKALYYPYIRFRDRHWLKVAALYWDSILRMVPPFMSLEKLDHRDDSFVQELKRGDPNFIKPVQLDENNRYVEWASRRLLKMIEDADAQPSSRSAYQTAMCQPDPNKLDYPVYNTPFLEKDLQFYSRLQERGLIRLDKEKPWLVYFTPTIGQIFMALLATHAAAAYNVPVVSPEVVYNDLLRSEFLLGNVSASGDYPQEQLPYELIEGFFEERLATMAFKAAVPDPSHLDEVSVDQILRFRQDYADERRSFFELMTKMADDLSNKIDPMNSDVLRDYLITYEPRVKERMENLRAGLAKTGIDALWDTLSLDGKIPLVDAGAAAAGITAVVAITHTPAFVVGGLAVGLIKVTRNWRQKRAQMRENSPYSYLLALNQLTQPQSLVERTMRHLAEFIRGQ